ncbi:alkaline phosphatase [Marinicrinis lubricantis]|uniref:Alkaline phosphatase n=1 Tax=Marinicrinis lubricantis TaxID=2086470 RepID=A0ABW1ITK0_9BACL
MMIASSVASAAPASPSQAEPNAKVKNVIFMVMDGVSPNATTLARWYSGQPMALDEMPTGLVRTYSAESAITDSAPAGTAFSTGNKSNSGYIGVLPSVVDMPGVAPIDEEDIMRPVANVLEGAKLKGKATGIIATSEIQHATPASFSSHHANRNNFPDIAEQQVYMGMDVVLGGGKQSLLPGEARNQRTDGENLIDVLETKGYDFVESREELLESNADKIWGSFSNGALAYDLDRAVTNPEQPTLAEMTEKAIDVLSKDKDGFFLFVEGSKPDWAAHANDTIGIITDVLAFDAAVKEALEFAKEDKHTLVIALADHGNSGISIGNVNTNSTYDETPISAYIDPLKKASMTIEGALSQLKEDRSNLLDVAALYGLDDLSEKEISAMKDAEDLSALQSLMVKALADRANIGYTTGGHTGEDITLYAYGPQKPIGLYENTEIAHVMADAIGIDLNELTEELFVEAEEGFGFYAAEVTLDTANEANPVLVVEKGSKRAELPIDKNIMIMNGKTIELNNVIVLSNEKVYVPNEAIEYFKGNGTK